MLIEYGLSFLNVLWTRKISHLLNEHQKYANMSGGIQTKKEIAFGASCKEMPSYKGSGGG